MKKIAIFVEGQTEQMFVHKLLTEIAGVQNITIELKKFGGCKKPTITVVPKTQAQPIDPQYEALIYDCAGGDGVKSRIDEALKGGLPEAGYVEIIGLVDLYPKRIHELEKFEAGLVIREKTPIPCSIVIAVHEIETWFLAEYNHFLCIDPKLTSEFISSQPQIDFNPFTDDMTLQYHPAEDLRNIYRLVGKTYDKSKKKVERTVDCLDYSHIYRTLRKRITKLDNFISRIETFLLE